MSPSTGKALEQFDAALRTLRDALASDRAVERAAFDGTDEWVNLLRYKLVPHLSGDGCLIAAVTGGTNTGKSTIFNMLLGRAVSPIEATAAATRRPVIAANATRAAQCFEGKLVPEFAARPLDDGRGVVAEDTPADALFVADHAALPDRLVLLDTPDVDSIDKEHWAVADNIRAAGDVLIAMVTGEKYKDDRVVAFFREAHASGRVVVPVMNKANPEDDFAVARRQLEEFRVEIGLDTPCFLVPHDFDLDEGANAAIEALDGGPHLMDYLLALDVPAIKERVYRATVAHFAERADAFLHDLGDLAAGMRSVVDEFGSRAASAASNYDPAPGAEVGGLFHEFVQSKRGPLRRWIGATSKTIAVGASAVGRSLRNALRKRIELEGPSTPNEDEYHAAHVRAIEGIARDLATSYVESSRNLREPSARLVSSRVGGIDVNAAVADVVRETTRADGVSAEFRRHAHRMLDAWWRDNTGRRRVLEALDAILAVTPSAIAAPLAIYTGGVGVSEAVVVAGPFVEQFVARVVEYQFGDAMFDFLSPWKTEQQQILEGALLAHLTGPSLAALRTYLEALESDTVVQLREWHHQCLDISATS
ncbi:MAG: hypothetical protein GY851_13000 [bacterium]|nr:hypothetical protein [bacterium]